MLLFDALQPGFHIPFLQPNDSWSIYTELFSHISSAISVAAELNLFLFFILFYLSAVAFSAFTTQGFMGRFLEFKNNPVVLFFVIFLPIYLLFQPTVVNIVKFDPTSSASEDADFDEVTIIKQFNNIPLVISLPLAIAQSFTHGISHYNCGIDDSDTDNIIYTSRTFGTTPASVCSGQVGSLITGNYDRKLAFTDAFRDVSIRDFWFGTHSAVSSDISDDIVEKTITLSVSPSEIILNDISKIRNAINNLRDRKCVVGPTTSGSTPNYGLICNHYQRPGDNLSQIVSGFFAEAYYLRNILDIRGANASNIPNQAEEAIVAYFTSHPIFVNLLLSLKANKPNFDKITRKYSLESIIRSILNSEQPVEKNSEQLQVAGTQPSSDNIFGAALVAYYTDKFMTMINSSGGLQKQNVISATDAGITPPSTAADKFKAYQYLFIPIVNDINVLLGEIFLPPTDSALVEPLALDTTTCTQFASSQANVYDTLTSTESLTSSITNPEINTISHHAFKLHRLPKLLRTCRYQLTLANAIDIPTKIENIEANTLQFLEEINSAYYTYFFAPATDSPFSEISTYEEVFWNVTLPNLLSPTPFKQSQTEPYQNITDFTEVLKYTFSPPLEDILIDHSSKTVQNNYFTSTLIPNSTETIKTTSNTHIPIPISFSKNSPIYTSGYVDTQIWSGITTDTVNELLTTGIDKNAFANIISLILKTGFVSIDTDTSNTSNKISPAKDQPYKYTSSPSPSSPLFNTPSSSASVLSHQLTPPPALGSIGIDYANTLISIGSPDKKFFPLDNFTPATASTTVTLSAYPSTPTISTSPSFKLYNSLNQTLSHIIQSNFIYYYLKNTTRSVSELLCHSASYLCELTPNSMLKFKATGTPARTVVTVEDVYYAIFNAPSTSSGIYNQTAAINWIYSQIKTSKDTHAILLRPIILQLMEVEDYKDKISTLTATSTATLTSTELNKLKRSINWNKIQYGFSQNRLISLLMAGYNINHSNIECKDLEPCMPKNTDNSENIFQEYKHILLDPRLIRLTGYFPARAPNHLDKVTFDPLIPDTLATTETFDHWVGQEELEAVANAPTTTILPFSNEGDATTTAGHINNFFTWPFRVLLARINEFSLTTIGGLASGYISYHNLYLPIPPITSAFVKSTGIFPQELGLNTTSLLSSIVQPQLNRGDDNPLYHYISYFQNTPNLNHNFINGSTSLHNLQENHLNNFNALAVAETTETTPEAEFNRFLVNINYTANQYSYIKSEHFNNNFKIHLSNEKNAQIHLEIDAQNTIKKSNTGANIGASALMSATAIFGANKLDIADPLLKATKITALSIGIFALGAIVFSLIFTFKFITKVIFLKILPFLMLLLIVPFNFARSIFHLTMKGVGATPEEAFSVFVEKSLTKPTLMLLSLTFQTIFYISIFNHLFVSLYLKMGPILFPILSGSNTLVLFELALTISLGAVSVLLLFVMDIFDRIPFFKASPAELWQNKSGVQ